MTRLIRLSITLGFATLVITMTGCSRDNLAASASSATAVEVDTKSLYASVLEMDQAAKVKVFAQLRLMSFESYYQFIAAGLDDAPVRIDNKVVSGLRSKWVKGHADLTKIGQLHANLGSFWRQLGIHPERLSAKDLESQGTGKAQLALGATYAPDTENRSCDNAFAYAQREHNASSTALAAAYSRLPVSGRAQWAPVEGSNNLVVNGTQAVSKFRLSSPFRGAAYLVSRGGGVEDRLSGETFFIDCMKRRAPGPGGAGQASTASPSSSSQDSADNPVPSVIIENFGADDQGNVSGYYNDEKSHPYHYVTAKPLPAASQ